MKTVTTAWVFNRPYIFLAEDKGLAYDSEISKDFHNVIRANSADDISIQHIKDMHFTNEELMSAIDEEIAYLERKRVEIKKLIYGY